MILSKPFMYILQASNVEGDFFDRPIKSIPFTYVYFHVVNGEWDGKRVLVIHGSEEGMWTPEGHAALKKYDAVTDIIISCSPSMVRFLQNDPRVYGHSMDRVRITGQRHGTAITFKIKSGR